MPNQSIEDEAIAIEGEEYSMKDHKSKDVRLQRKESLATRVRRKRVCSQKAVRELLEERKADHREGEYPNLYALPALALP